MQSIRNLSSLSTSTNKSNGEEPFPSKPNPFPTFPPNYQPTQSYNSKFTSATPGIGGNNSNSSGGTSSNPHGTFKRTTDDKVAQIFQFAGYESRVKLDTAMPGTMVTSVYEIEPLYVTVHIPHLPNKDPDFFHYRFGIDFLRSRDKCENLLLWDISEYNYNGRRIYTSAFKSGQITELVYETSQHTLEMECYVIDLRTKDKFPINSYSDEKMPISLTLRVYKEDIH